MNTLLGEPPRPRELGERRFRPGAEVADRLARRQTAETCRPLGSVAVSDPEAEPGGEQVARTGQIDDPVDRAGGYGDDPVRRPDQSTFLTEGHRHREAGEREGTERATCGRGAGEGEELGFVGKHDVDRPASEAFQDHAMPFNQQRVRQPEGDGRAPGARYLHCGLCATAWNHVRAVCINCGDSRSLVLQELAGGNGAVKAETCDACHGYAKMLYQEQDMAVEAMADDLASLGLDIKVSEAGWSRHAPNPLILAR